MPERRYRPISPDVLAREITERIVDGPITRVAFDGAGEAPGVLADAVAELLRPHGKQALRVSTKDFLRAASLRFERGKRDPDARYDDWLDVGALRREVLDPAGPGGTGLALPALWDAERDRATRLDRVPLLPGAVVLVDGELLLGHGLPFDFTAHLLLSPGALTRRLPPEEHWALPAFERYDTEVAPGEFADVVVRMDDPKHPALIERT
ncbi:uridine kinase [Amycolatopsis sp. YIM 10]|uniref:uridine kinase n=1 Tax=Amycolatopsis sp. YIM 10 TaxID=2653857 RepID=UPI0012906C92|nr:uridine kinase [Amycolatopsis sp. YIM 10]QFU87673.1 uridine kinase [Amycolatopsis sp. YIM 10]